MFICLDNGKELQIEKVPMGFQVVEVIYGFAHNPKKCNVGKPHKEFQAVIDEVLHYASQDYEVLALNELAEVYRNTLARIEEYFELHSEYLVNLK